MANRVATGITGLDELLGGGLPENGAYCVVGASGTGKSIFCQQFLHSGVNEYGENGVCVLLEESKSVIEVNMMDSFGWDIKKMQDEHQLKVIPYIKSIIGDVEAQLTRDLNMVDSNRIESMREILTIDSLIKEIEQEVKSIGAKRVVIDPLSMITLLSETEILTRLYLLLLFDKLKKLDVTTLVVVEEDIGYWQDSLFLADGIIQLVLKENHGIYERGLVIKKMRGSGHDTGIRPLQIDSDGVRIDTEELVLIE